MRRAIAVLIIAFSIGVAPGSTATAGGWWSSLNADSYVVAPGQTVHLETEFLFRTLEAAETARLSGGYFIYLISDLDERMLREAMSRPWPRDWWDLGSATAQPIGEPEFVHWDANLARITATVVVPEVPPGKYSFMACDAGCAHPLGDITPTGISVVADPLTARLIHRADRMEARFAEVSAMAVRARTHARAAEAKAVIVEDQNDDLRIQIMTLSERLDRVAGAGWPAPVWMTIGALVAISGGTLLRHYRRRYDDGPFDDLTVELFLSAEESRLRR